VLAAFKDSVEFAHYFEMNGGAQGVVDAPSVISPSVPVDSAITPTCQGRPIDSQVPQQGAVLSQSEGGDTGGLDRIPVRLPGARRAWLLIPTPFFKADKERLKAQIDLLLTEEDEEEARADVTE
jgi:hypothetical protein